MLPKRRRSIDPDTVEKYAVPCPFAVNRKPAARIVQNQRIISKIGILEIYTDVTGPTDLDLAVGRNTDLNILILFLIFKIDHEGNRKHIVVRILVLYQQLVAMNKVFPQNLGHVAHRKI